MKNSRRLLELSTELRMGSDSEAGHPCNRIHGLVDLIQRVDIENKIICEIGCFLGVSTETFALFNPKKLYAIDIWGKNQNYAESNWAIGEKEMTWAEVKKSFDQRLSKYPEVEAIQEHSTDAVNLFEGDSLDMVYIDGDHTYDFVFNDLNNWFPKVKQGGFIAGHDHFLNGVNCAVSDFIKNNYKLEVFEDTSWLFQK
jgi:predicted O-methyltransferase YrrM